MSSRIRLAAGRSKRHIVRVVSEGPGKFNGRMVSGEYARHVIDLTNDIVNS